MHIVSKYKTSYFPPSSYILCIIVSVNGNTVIKIRIAIKEKVDNCDYVYAPIADNKLFEVIDAFVAEEITDLQCLYALSATHLGYQYVLKTERALENLNIIDHLYFSSVEKSLYNKESDVENNTFGFNFPYSIIMRIFFFI